jgi:hypothetical protein
MSVVKSKRSKPKLGVLTKARKLAVYTLRICSNEKNFPKRLRWCMINDIVKDARDIHRYIRKANSIYVAFRSDFDTRRQFQNQAIASIDAMLGDMDIAYALFNVDDDRIEYWTGLVIEVQNLLREWRKSDQERYKSLK